MRLQTTFRELVLFVLNLFLFGALFAHNSFALPILSHGTLSGEETAQRPSSQGAASSGAFEQIKADINRAGGIYYMYPVAKPTITPAPKGYEPFYISHYGRHGARLILNEREYSQVAEILTKAHVAGQLTDKGEQAYTRFMAIYPFLQNRSGDLTRKGYQQHKDLAKRMFANYPAIFKKKPQVVAYATIVPRCIMSMSAFCEGLKEQDPTLNVYKEASVANMAYLNPHSAYNPSATEKDHEFKTSKSPWRTEHRKFFEERLQPDTFLSRLFVNLNYAKFICDPVHFQRDFFAIASHMQCTDFDQSFYDFFTEEELCRLWECDNYMFYVEKGPDPRNKGRLSALAERLLENMLNCADEDIAQGKPNIRLRFGHDGCIMGMLSLMQLDGWSTPVTDPLQIKEVWQSYKIPMAANVQLIFYKHPKQSEILVRMLLNEQELTLPLPGDKAPYYRWTDFRTYYGDVVQKAKQLLASTVSKAKLTGVVRAEGKPLAGVRVSDGVTIVTTDQNGRYRMESDKAEGMVFVITPAHYVARSSDGLQPAFWAMLTQAPGTSEQHDFELKKEDQSQYSIVFMTDVHLTQSNRVNDIAHFRKLVMPSLSSLKKEYGKQGPVYSLNLGDLSHDLYWYENNFTIASARDFLVKEKFPMQMYSIPGNHDNDGAMPGPNADFEAGWLYRKTFGPTYFSMDIGGAHWIMMDDIVYKNTPNQGKKGPGLAGARDYTTEFTQRQMAWLRKDLSYVSDTTPVYLCTHSPLLHTNKRGLLISRTSQMDSLNNCFRRFPNVQIFSGHAHKMVYVKNHQYPRFDQWILPAASGNMWTTSNDFQTICTDGADAGLVVGNYQGKKATYAYHSHTNGIKVMRAYDMNAVGAYYQSDSGIREQQKIYPDRLDYGKPAYANAIYLNYWFYKPGEKVEMFENGKSLLVEKVNHGDPLYNISYYIPDLKENKTFKASRAKESNPHLFAGKASSATSPIEIRISDASGRMLYKEIVIRPKPFDKDIR